jgi:hypothetical protein
MMISVSSLRRSLHPFPTTTLLGRTAFNDDLQSGSKSVMGMREKFGFQVQQIMRELALKM